MPKQMPPTANNQVPDPSDCYERSHPEHESGQGRLDNNTHATPTKRGDKMAVAVTNAQDGNRQINAHETVRPPQSDHSMMAEEPMGWDV